MAATTGPPPLPLPNELILLAEAQWLFPESDLLHTPSVIAGLTPTQERENRAKGVNFILQVGIMLKLPQITLATASVFLHRFFMRYPMVEDRVAGRQHQHYYSIAATCLFLATKVEENCRKMKDLVVACVRVAQKEPNKEVDEQDKEFWRWRDVILQLEDLLLDAMCFDLSLESPYKLLYNFLVHFQEENNKPLRNAAWAFVNDSCLTPLCLLYPARTIAAAAIYAAARHCEIKLLDDERGRPWWEVAGSDLTSIRKACNYMSSLYENVATSNTNGDSGKPSIYQHTPESSGEERFAKTRAYRPGVSPQDSRQSSPLSGPLHHSQPLQSTRDRTSSNHRPSPLNGGSSNHSNSHSNSNSHTNSVTRSRKRSRGDSRSNSEEGEIEEEGAEEDEEDEEENEGEQSHHAMPTSPSTSKEQRPSIPWGRERDRGEDAFSSSEDHETSPAHRTKRQRVSESAAVNGTGTGTGTGTGIGGAATRQRIPSLPTTITTATALGVTVVRTDSLGDVDSGGRRASRASRASRTSRASREGNGDGQGSEEGEL